MESKLCIFMATENMSKTLHAYDDIISGSIKNFKNLLIINLINIISKNENFIYREHKDLKKRFNENIEFFYPKNSREFNNLVKNKKILAFDVVGKTEKYFKIRRLFNKKNIRLILVMNHGFLSNEETYGSDNYKSYIFEKKIKIIKKIYRFLVLIKYLPPTFLYFESRREIYENCRLNKSNIFSKILPFLNMSYFKNVYLINSKAYDYESINKDISIQNQITFLDGNYKHKEIMGRIKMNSEDLKKRYFKKLKIIFDWLSKIYNQKVVICLHPTSDIFEYKEYFTNCVIKKYETQKNISESSVVLFHESGSITDAILKKKKIISLSTRIFGSYVTKRIELYRKKINLVSIDIDNDSVPNQEVILKKLEHSVKNYEHYIENYLKSDKDHLGIDKIIKTIKIFI